MQNIPVKISNHEVAPVSVIIPCWRCVETIGRALASVAAQTVRPAEVLLVDDASGDGTLEMLHQLAAEYPQGWVRVSGLQANAGPGGARNMGWDNATQPWIAFLDADDAWHPLKIQIQLAWIQAYPDTALCGHSTMLAPSDGRIPEVAVKPEGVRVTFIDMLIANRFPTRSVMMQRDLPFRFGGKDVTEDYLLWLEVILAGLTTYRLDAPLAFSFRTDFSPGGYSGQLWRHEKRELAAWRLLREQGLISVVTCTIVSTWSLVKYIRRATILG